MKPAALISSLLVLLLLVLAVFFLPSPAPDRGQADGQTVEQEDATKPNQAPRSAEFADRLNPARDEPESSYVRPRNRPLLNAGGRVVPYASSQQIDTAGGVFDAVLGLMRERELEKGYTPDDFADVVVSSESFSSHNGVTHLYLRQRISGIEVYNGDANANVAEDGTVLSLHNRFVEDLESEINRTEPVISAEEAIEMAARDLGVPEAETSLVIRDPERGPDRVTVFEGGEVSQDPIPAKLMFLPQPDAVTRLVWNLVIHLPASAQWMDVNIDAENGNVLSRANWYAHADYRVFPFPYETPLDGGRELVSDPEDATASPFGWHDTDGVSGAEFTDTRGNNVSAQDDTNANNSGGSRPDGGAGLVFDNDLDLAMEPSTYLDGAITNLFYWNNILHDIHYQYGFNEAAGNFQENNYGNGGFGSDSVNADAQDGSGTNNANFGTPPDGSNPRMQMFVWTRTTPNRDSDLDNVIIIHEYGHGVSNRLTGGAANSSALSSSQSRGMGEGWSDWWGMALTAKADQASNLSRSVGYYVLGQNSSGGGIRPRPYTTDMSVNEYTYGDLPSGLSVPHGIGFVWCSILWEMYWELVDFHGFDPDIYTGSGGNNIALQLVMDGLKLQPAIPTYLEARDAILLADQVNNGGANANLIWQAFAKRGMGFSASDSGNPNNLAVTEAFDLPDEQFSIDDVTVTEGNAGTVDATFTVTLSPAAVETTTVSYATVDGTASSPGDFTSVTGSLSFAIGEESKTVVVPIVGDNALEEDETFTVQLSNPTNGILLDGIGVGTIMNDDYVAPVIDSALTASATTGQEFSYQITAQNVPRSFSIVGTPPAGMTIDNSTGLISWTPFVAGDVPVSISATNPGGTDTETLVISVVDEAIKTSLDTDLPIQNGSPGWFHQTLVTQDGIDAAQSGTVGRFETSWFEMDVTGPDTLRFWWKVSSELDGSYLVLRDNGTFVNFITGERDWRPVVYEIPAGDHTIRWSYEKYTFLSVGSDAGWVDMITLDSEDLRPVILSSDQVEGILNWPFTHQIETTHSATSFSVSGILPGGLSFDTSTGLISGMPTQIGIFPVTIGATNSEGTVEQVLTIDIQDPVGMAKGLDTSLTFNSGPIPWFIQTGTTHDGVDAAQSGSIGDGESTWFEAEVAGPDTLSFWWKVSSESGLDFLKLLDDGVEVTSVSGEEDWRQITYEIPEGLHTMRWVYEKDEVISNGDDAAWVDEITLATSGVLSEAIDNTEVTPVSGLPRWFSQSDTTYEGAYAAESGDADDEESSMMQLLVEGPDTVAFQWKVSSEENYDYLRFFVDYEEIAAISGEVGWERFVHEVPAGTHLLKWEFDKDLFVSGGSDVGWLDDFALLSRDRRPFISSASRIFGRVGESLNFQVATAQPATLFTSGVLPAGLSLNAATGLVSGTPTALGTSVVRITASNAHGSDTQFHRFVISDLPEALDTTLDVSTGAPPWFSQTAITHDGVDAAQTPILGDGELAFIDMEAVGPDTVEFWWKVSSEPDSDQLIFSVDGSAIESISGEVDWVKMTHAIPEGAHILRWEYYKSDSGASGSDAGWVDEISFQSSPVPQVINFPAIPDQAERNTLPLEATGGDSGKPVTFAITSGPAVLNHLNVLRFTGTGAVSVTASQAGTQRHLPAADVTRTFMVASVRALFDSAVSAAGLSSTDALPNATPFGGGVTNLEKYAFNMDLGSLDLHTMTDGGSSGLPLLQQAEVDDTPYWTLQFVRRKGSGLVYTPKTSSTLVSNSFVAVSDPGTVTSIDENWERVEIQGSMPDGPLFIIVEVRIP